MEFDIASWLSLALRWFHLITGICWIGASFYFIWLDNSLTPPESEKDKKDGVTGELWAVHGGGFYHNKKYMVAPPHMPEHLHWFKWEAYFTWISGMLLLGLIYYYGANMYLIDTAKANLTQTQAILIGLAFIGGGWLFYDGLCKTQIGEHNGLFGLIWFAALVVAGFFLNQIFSDRGAFIHVGAMVGTAMAANVFAVIIPNQKKVVASLLAGEKPDPALGRKAKQRSLHNNYMTLPVLLIMISSHYPVLVGNPYNWALLAGLGVAAWFIRQFFNLQHKGKTNYLYPAIGITAYIVVMILAAHWQAAGKPAADAAIEVSDAQARTILRTHCTSCHSDTPTHPAFPIAPTGVMFDTMEQIKIQAARIDARTVIGGDMPLGNETGMTDEERQTLGAWLKSLKN